MLHFEVLQVKPAEHGRVEYILLDPSCSGSGIVNRDDHLTSVGTTKVCMFIAVWRLIMMCVIGIY